VRNFVVATSRAGSPVLGALKCGATHSRPRAPYVT
jgi:hypothetical protein